MVALCAPALPARAADTKPATRIKVFCYVEPNASGFVDQRSRNLTDSLKDLKQSLEKKDWVELEQWVKDNYTKMMVDKAKGGR